jgi:hypothetical protein
MSRAWLTGFGGEVGRAFYWRAGDDPVRPPSPERMIERLNLPRDDRTLAAWRAWQESAPHADTFDLLDLAYIEQRMGCWAGPHMYGAAPFAANLSVFVRRDVFTAMMRLPVSFRRDQKLAETMIDVAWPELGELPFQQLTGIRRVMNGAERQLRTMSDVAVGRARRVAGRILRAIGAKK